jgi:hypothetical protein
MTALHRRPHAAGNRWWWKLLRLMPLRSAQALPWLLLMLLAVSCTNLSQTHVQGDLSVEELLQHLPDHPDVVVSVQSGIPNWRSGEVLLSIGGDGSVKIRNRRSSGEQSFAGQLDRTTVQALGQEFAQQRFTESRSSSAVREPGDVPIVLQIERGARQVYEARLWYADRYTDSGLDRILERSSELVEQISKGALSF